MSVVTLSACACSVHSFQSIMTYIPLSVFAGRPGFVIIYSFLVHRSKMAQLKSRSLVDLHNGSIACVCMI